MRGLIKEGLAWRTGDGKLQANKQDELRCIWWCLSWTDSRLGAGAQFGQGAFFLWDIPGEVRVVHLPRGSSS